MRSLVVKWVFLTSMPWVFVFQTQAAPCVAGGQLAGFVFNDYNGDTIRGGTNIETGVSDVTVTVFSDDGSTLSCESLADGSFSVDAPSGGFPVRMEVAIPADKDYLFSGVSGPTRVQFFTAADANIDVGLLNPKEYCDDNPLLATTCFVNGNPELNDGVAGTASVADVLVGFPYNASGNTAATNNNYLAFGGEVGATWGLAFQRQSDLLMAASVMKRHVGFAQLGPGGIYQVDMTDPANPVASDFVNLAAAPYNIDFGADSHVLNSSDPQVPTHDPSAWDDVGKVSYGGLAFSDDETTIWTVNLFDRNLYEIPVGIPATLPVAADINNYAIPSPGCLDSSVVPAVPAPDDSRPWAVEFYQGMVYVGVVCSAQTSQLTVDLTATLYRFDPENTAGGFTTVVSFPLNYTRGYVSEQSATNRTDAEWFAWIDEFNDIPNIDQTYGQAIYPQPIFTDLTFDTDGSIIVALVDRLGHQMGNANYGTDTGSTMVHEAAVAGDILRVCFDGTTYSLEDNASCDGGVTETGGADGADGGQGPGGGEWYWQDMFRINTNQDAGNHDEVTLGGVAHLPGSGQVVVSAFDPTNEVRSGGARWFNHITGESDQEYMVFDTDAGGGATTFGKSAGLGDVELLCPQAPLEIGNRLWCDSDLDGIQDPSEGVISGVTVTLQCGADLPVTAVTNGSGEYYFNDVIYDTTNSSPIPRNAACNVSVDTNVAANATAITGACSGILPTVANNGGTDPASDLRDSDGVDDGTGVINVDIITGFAGQNNHAIDFGFGVNTDLGDNPDPDYSTLLANNGPVHTVIPGLFLGACVDTEVDGLQNATASGDDGAVGVGTLGTCATAGDDEDGVSDLQNLFVGNGTASLDVTSTGACRLDGWIDFNQNGSFGDAGEQIFTNQLLANGANNDLNFAIPATATAGDTFSRFRCSSAGGLAPTGAAPDGEVEDYPITILPDLMLGDFVWYDTNQNGQQDGGEPGVNGITVNLYNNNTCTGAVFDTTTTANGGIPAADGFYQFSQLIAGPYCVEFTGLPVNYQFTTQNSGNDATDSDANPTDGQVININLTADDPTIDAGVFLDGSIAGLTWCESTTNANTVYNPGDGDTVLTDIGITLYTDANCNNTVDGTEGTTAVTQDTANPAGTYLFSDLPVGPSGAPVCYITEVNTADADLGACDSGITPSTLGPDLDVDTPNSTGNNFGFEENLSLGDFVWFDTNQNGQQDGGEPGVNGITVNLYNNATCTAPVLNTTSTVNGGTPAADGFYQFTGLAAGPYCVEFTGLPVNYQFTAQNSGNDATDSDANPANGQVTNINLTADDPTIDAGVFLNGSIAGLTWCESSTNANTAYNPGDGDAVLTDIGITLYEDANCNNTVDGTDAGTAVNQDTANPGGTYLFSNLPVGPVGAAICYVVEVDDTDADLGACDTGITPVTQGPDLDTAVPDVTDVNFGFDDNLGLGDFVWFDTNQNGQQDVGEPGVNGITVNLYDNATCTAPIVDTTTTANGGTPAADGYYFFGDLDPDDYCVEFTNLPAGYEFTAQNQGADTSDSDADPVTGQVQNITLTEVDPTIDAGMFLNGSIAGLTWCESSTNSNTTYDVGDGDSVLTDIGITLYEDANCNDTVDGTEGTTAVNQDTTNPGGTYLFSDLPVGPVGAAVCYVVEVDDTDADLGTCDTGITPVTQGPDLDTAVPDVTDVNFGFDDNLGLGDFVWFDTNQNGQQDAGEPGVNGITVNLYDNATCTAPVVDTTTTANGGTPAADGYYFFGDLDPDDYCVEFTGLPAGYDFTAQNNGNDNTDSDADPITGQVQNITLTEVDPTIDAGVFLNGSIAGLTWCESSTNSNTTYNPGDGDTVLTDITVTLYEDADCSDTVNGTEGTTALSISTTNPGGTYLFDDLPVGPSGNPVCYVTEVDVDDTDLGACDSILTPETQGPDLDVDTPDVTDVNFGFDDNIGLGDYVWYDNNQNGQQDADEPGVNGITVNLYDNATCTAPAVDTTTTAVGGTPAVDGYYFFGDLDPGSYCVELTGLPVDYVFTDQNTGDDTSDSDADPVTGQVLNINLTTTDLTIDAGIYAANGQVSGLLYCDDSPENGTQDAGEEVAGVTVTLSRDFDCDDAADEVIGTMNTDGTGSFLFDNLAVGLAPAPPNPQVCYVLEYNNNDPLLSDCNQLVTPQTQTVTIDTVDPEAPPVTFIVINGVQPPPTQVPVNSMWMLILMTSGVLVLLWRHRRDYW